MQAQFFHRFRSFDASRLVPALLAGLMLLSACGEVLPEAHPLQLLDRNWEYRWGDSPRDSAGTPVWTRQDSGSDAWQPAELPFNPPGRNGAPFLWLRRRLPENRWPQPALYLNGVIMSPEVFIGETPVFRHGHFRPHPDNRYAAARWYLIPLPEQTAGRMLYLRIFSDDPGHIGLPLQGDNQAFLGSYPQLIRFIIHTSIDRFVLGCLFLLIGFMSIDLFFHRWQQRAYVYIAFGAFTFCTGLFYVSTAEMTQFLFPAPHIRFIAGSIGMVLFPVGLFAFYELILESPYRLLIRRIWQVMLVCGLLLVGLQLSGILFFNIPVYLTWAALLVGSLITGFVVGVRSTTRGNVNAMIFNFGFLVTLLLMVHDLLFGIGAIPYWRWLSHWGVFVFVLSLTHIIERKNADDERKLQHYSRELQEYSKTLEEKVDARTRDLRDKNRALQDALAELQETQQQLLMKEKMASLGHLVAGIAHDVNNPMGAIHSAADVSARCIAQLERVVTEGDNHNPERDRQMIRLLEDNTRVIHEASHRIARIVESLKHFAQLDQAEYRRIDLNQALNHILTLLEADLRNRVKVIRDFGDIPEITCYAGQLNQVFMHLLRNALQAIDGRGTIRIATRVDGGQVQVKIGDSGRGIPPDKMAHLFEFGFSESGNRIKMGSGLSTAFQIVQKHNGIIRAESTPGEGSTFTVTLPVK